MRHALAPAALLLLAACGEDAEPAVEAIEPTPAPPAAPVADPIAAPDPLDAAIDDAVANAESRVEEYARENPPAGD